MAELPELLEAIDPSRVSYEEWTQIGMATIDNGGSVADWDQWSARDPERYQAGQCERKAKSFTGSATPVGLGTIAQIAKRHGWIPAQHSAGHALDWNATIDTTKLLSLEVEDPGWVEPIDVVPPDSWDPIQQLIKYLNTLFSSEEYVGYVTESYESDGRSLPKRGSYSRTCGELIQNLEKYGQIDMALGTPDPDVGAWIRFNPLDGKGVKDTNVTAHRYALIESDTLPIDRQAGIYKAMELPIAALVHSGGKSLHAIVRIDAASKEEYRQRVNYLHKVCAANHLEIDTQNKNPSRLSRMPGVMRKGQKQFLVDVNQGHSTWDEWVEYVEDKNDNLPPFTQFADIFHDLPPLATPLIDGILREGHKMLLAGPSKAGKSFMLLQLAVAVAEGKSWLGWQCRQGRVLYVNLEVDASSCAHRIRDLYDKRGWAPDATKNLDVWNLRGKAAPLDVLAPKLINRAKDKQYKVIIIDPIYKVITGDENAADKMAHFCNQFDKICAELECAVVYCHHHSKGAQGAKEAKDRASGSGVFARDPDAQLDVVQLMVPEDARKAMADRVMCQAIVAAAERHTPDWSDKLGQDDVLVLEKVTEAARALLGSSHPAWQQINQLRTELGYTTGWRVELTLREFAPQPPIAFWFRHPIHTTEGADFLASCKANGEVPPWELERQERQEKKKKDFDKIARDIGFHITGDRMDLDELAGLLGQTPRQVKGWVKDSSTHENVAFPDKREGITVCLKGQKQLVLNDYYFRRLADSDGKLTVESIKKDTGRKTGSTILDWFRGDLASLYTIDGNTITQNRKDQ